MNEYEGLNLPQLLDLLHDIVRPDPVAWTPQTIGWAIVAAWLLVVILLIGWNRIQKWRRNRYRSDALAMLKDIGAQADESSSAVAGQVALLIKRTALVAYSRAEVANLYGSEWAAFLRQSAGNDPVVEKVAGDLASAAYRVNIDGGKLIEAARRWIKVHRA